MNAKYCARHLIVCSIVLVGAAMCVLPSGAFAQSADVKALTVNRDVYIGRVSLQKARTRALRQFSQKEAARLLEPFAKMVKTEYSGEITDFQFRYHLGRRAFVIRGQRTGSIIKAYVYQDGEFDFSEWVNIPSALTGPFVALPRNEVNRMSDEHQKHFEALFGRNVMLEDMQLEFTGSLYGFVGAMRWKPPNTHLHAVIVIMLAD